MLSLFVGFVIIVTAIIATVDVIGFYLIRYVPKRLTIPYVILIIIATVIPIVIDLWYWLVFK
jgi:ABC-type transport system involved in cytochrome bd biosynthesis fused ATPase/permease subunit